MIIVKRFNCLYCRQDLSYLVDRPLDIVEEADNYGDDKAIKTISLHCKYCGEIYHSLKENELFLASMEKALIERPWDAFECIVCGGNVVAYRLIILDSQQEARINLRCDECDEWYGYLEEGDIPLEILSGHYGC